MENVVVRAILLSGKKVLLGRKTRGDGKGKYALLGGKPIRGETPEKALIREVKEVAGFNIIKPKLYKKEIIERTPGEKWVTLYFVGEARGVVKLKKDEVDEVVYVGEEDLESRDMAFTHKEVLEEFFKSLRK